MDSHLSSDPLILHKPNAGHMDAFDNSARADNHASPTDDAALLVPHPTLSASSAAALCAAVPGKWPRGHVVMWPCGHAFCVSRLAFPDTSN